MSGGLWLKAIGGGGRLMNEKYRGFVKLLYCIILFCFSALYGTVALSHEFPLLA